MIPRTLSPAHSTSGRLVIFSVALSALTVACGSRPPEAVGVQAITPTQQYALVEPAVPFRIGLAIHAEGLSPNQQSVLGDFVRRWRETGAGSIEIGAPATGADPVLARRTADAVSSFLARLGAPPSLVKIVGYDPAGRANPPVYASFSSVQPAAPDCSKIWDNLTSTGDNRPSVHFGCAVTANMAQQVADPSDLRAPAAVAGSDGLRRQVVLEKYRQGAVTSSSKDSQASGEVTQ
jgi:pilus assembly protein CpaD